MVTLKEWIICYDFIHLMNPPPPPPPPPPATEFCMHLALLMISGRCPSRSLAACSGGQQGGTANSEPLQSGRAGDDQMSNKLICECLSGATHRLPVASPLINSKAWLAQEGISVIIKCPSCVTICMFVQE